MRLHSTILSLLLCCSIASIHAHDDASETLQWRVLRAFPHDANHYTQGLDFHDGRIVESAGLYGRSALYEKALETGETLRTAQVSRNWFAEGVTVWRDRIVMLTWLERVAQVFDLQFNPIAQHTYRGEGWGLTHDDRQLIMSDGTATLRFRDADNFSVARELRVTDRGRPVDQLNELEYARGMIFANVWRSDRVAVIGVATGRVRAWIDLAPLKTRFAKPRTWDAREHVLNGIAYDADRDRFYVTGKCWPQLFELEIAPLSETQ